MTLARKMVLQKSRLGCAKGWPIRKTYRGLQSLEKLAERTQMGFHMESSGLGDEEAVPPETPATTMSAQDQKR
jgi:hypothetical protein